MTDKKYTLGIDIGSTTVKIAILDEENQLLFADYERHFANIQETLAHLLGIETREHDGAGLASDLGSVIGAVVGDDEHVDELGRIVLHLDRMDQIADDRALVACGHDHGEAVVLLGDVLLGLARQDDEHVEKLIGVADGEYSEHAEVKDIDERYLGEKLVEHLHSFNSLLRTGAPPPPPYPRGI